MVKHNNVIPNVHFHKEWDLRVRTWFNQPGKKNTRRRKRAEKAARVFPRPVEGNLRPIVQAPTNQYNRKSRLGRGFSLEELKHAGINPLYAKTVGIAVDHRRRNKSDEGLQRNVQRLKEYKSKLIVFPRNSKKPKSGDASAEDQKAAVQHKGDLLPIQREPFTITRRAVTSEDRKRGAYATIRKARSDIRLVGVRMKNKAKKADEAKNTEASKS